jgi:CRP-like cAMP-binding protein
VNLDTYMATITQALFRPSTDGTSLQVEGNPIGNRLLLNLPARECALLYPQLAFVEMRSQDVLQECEQPVRYAYFIESGVASVLNITEDGRSVEVGISGKDGCTGLPLAVGLKTSVCRVVVQIAGTAFRIAAPKLLGTLQQCPRLQSRIQQYSHFLAMQSAQIACCNRLHEVDGRLAKWLLMSHDRLESDLIPVTQEFVAQMLGTRRSSVTVAAGILQRAGLIRYVRGSVKITDRQGLEEASCECYRLLRKHTETWIREAI